MKAAQKGDKRVAVKSNASGRWTVTQQEYDGRSYRNCRAPEWCYYTGLLEVIERLQT